jgi:hypothetical protein
MKKKQSQIDVPEPEKQVIETPHENYEIVAEGFSLTFSQSKNLCERQSLMNVLKISTDTCHTGPKFWIQTEKWDFDDIEELIEILKVFDRKYKLMFGDQN